MPGIVVVGAQWGDEGKGKVVDLLAQRAQAVIRFQGGNNAGHTIIREGEADIIIAKHRNGAIGKVTLTFQKEYPKFLNYAGERFQ